MKKYVLTILVLEDDVEISKKITNYIRRVFNSRVQVLTAKTYEEGKEIIDSGIVDISLIDLGLPDGDGEALIAMIREQDKKMPIIIQTANDEVNYQLEIYKKYKNISYLIKSELFEQLAEELFDARDEVGYNKALRLAIPGQIVESVSVYDVCTIQPVAKSNHLEVIYYDFELEDYQSVHIKNTTLTEFMENYNEVGLFIRCHASHAVNKKMIKKIFRAGNEIEMLYRDKEGTRIYVPMSGKYKKEVIAQLKGLF
ncbi:MAG: response regulator [Defluviitaleaceae bacterium]|nr:response regulator [Defluviitaleaceae bacterium]